MATLRQIEANRSNALRSTGPAPEARDRTRRNALKTGLAGRGVVLPHDVEHAVAERTEQWIEALRPANPFQIWAVARAALESVRLEHCQQREIALRGLLALGAEHSWDEVRGLEAAELAEKLPRKPALVSRQLRQTAQGCEVPAGAVGDAQDHPARLRRLGRRAVRPGDGPDRRAGRAAGRLDAAGGAAGVAQAEHLMGLVDDAIAGLTERQSGVLAEADAAEREAALAGRYDDAELKRLRRYEATCMGHLRWAVAQLSPAPAAVEAPAEAPAVAVEVAVAVADITAAPPPAPKPAPEPTDAECLRGPAPEVMPVVAIPGDAEAPRLEPGSRRARRAR